MAPYKKQKQNKQKNHKNKIKQKKKPQRKPFPLLPYRPPPEAQMVPKAVSNSHTSFLNNQ